MHLARPGRALSGRCPGTGVERGGASKRCKRMPHEIFKADGEVLDIYSKLMVKGLDIRIPFQWRCSPWPLVECLVLPGVVELLAGHEARVLFL